MKALFIHPLPPLAGFPSLSVSVLILIGWALDSTNFRSLPSHLASMMPNAALAFIFAGVSVLAASIRPQLRGVRLVAAGSAVPASKFPIVDDEGSRRGQH